MMHWSLQYIGKPYEVCARGPERFDCFGLLWHIYSNVYAIDLGEFLGITASPLAKQCAALEGSVSSDDWVEVETPFDGCAVAMGQRKVLHHVGIYLAADGGKILHADKPMVVAATLKRLKMHGFKTIRFYRHKLWPTSS